MALQGVPTDGIIQMFVDDFARADLDHIKFMRAAHHHETPYPVLKGKKKAIKLARKLGVFAEIKWVRDPDWEPLKVEWREDDSCMSS